MRRIVWVLIVASRLAQAAASNGERIFSVTCAACHGLDGRGGEHAPDIAASGKARALTDEELTQVLRKGIPAAGMPAFGESLKQEQIAEVVHYLRVLQHQPGQAVLPGNPALGKQIFFAEKSCAACHLMNGQGGFIGPDLSSFGKIHNESEIRQAIIEPEKNFDWRHPLGEVSLDNGTTIIGIIRNEDNFSLQMQSLDGGFHLLNKAAVVTIKRETKSVMPDNYATSLSKTEINDLIAYLINAATGKPSQNRNEDDN